jgi:hypothetical protein
MLVTLNDMKNYLNIPLTDTSQDVFLTQQLQYISDVIEQYCGRKFLQATYTQTFYFDDFLVYPKELELFMFPLVSVTTIEEDGEPIDDYRSQLPSATLIRPKGWFQTGEELIVEYVAGYTAAPIPVRQVVFDLVQERYNKQNSGVPLNFGSDVQRVSIPGTISIDFDYTLTSNERQNGFGSVLGKNMNILDFYRSERAIIGNGRLVYVG